MGKIKTSMIKKLGEELIKNYSDKFGKDFEKNKEVIKEILDIKSKKFRNILAGYITKVMKRKE